MLGHVVAGGLGLLGHELLLQAFGETLGECDVSSLAAFVAAGEQHDEFPSAPCVVDAVPRTGVDPHFGDPAPDGCAVAGIPGGEPLDARKDAGSSTQVAKSVDPSGEWGRLADFHNAAIVACRLHVSRTVCGRVARSEPPIRPRAHFGVNAARSSIPSAFSIAATRSTFFSKPSSP